MRHSSSSHIVNMQQKTKKTVLCIPPFVPDDVGKLSLLKAHRKQIEKWSTNHRHSQNETLIQFSYRQYAKKQIKEGAVHSTLRPRWCEEIQLPQSLPNAYWLLIDTSPKIKKWDTPLVLISSTCNKNKQKNGAMHSTLRPWWCGEAHIDENRGLDESKIVGNQCIGGSLNGLGHLWRNLGQDFRRQDGPKMS